jgi:hypothetical protein
MFIQVHICIYSFTILGTLWAQLEKALNPIPQTRPPVLFLYCESSLGGVRDQGYPFPSKDSVTVPSGVLVAGVIEKIEVSPGRIGFLLNEKVALAGTPRTVNVIGLVNPPTAVAVTE